MLWKGASLLLLANLGTSSPWHRRDAEILPSILARQVADDPPIGLCFASCDVTTCGGGTCSIGASLAKRSFDDLETLMGSFASINVTSANSDEEELDTKSISKRIWRFDPSATTSTGSRAPTFKQASAYLPAVFHGEEFDYFGNALSLAHENPTADERAVSQQVEFKTGKDSKPFQIMTGGIHGCTTITLVSNRAVWMAHFWETYSNRVREDKVDFNENSDEPDDWPVFVQRILMFIRGEQVTNPATNFDKPYITPEGPFIQADLFNGDDDETKLFISTPIPLGQQLSRRSTLRYPNRVNRIVDAFEARLGKMPEVDIIPYQALNYNDPKDKAQVGKNARGHHLFQFDTNSDGNGQRAWRYFAEASYRIKNVP